jgi:hypothetical protein
MILEKEKTVTTTPKMGGLRLSMRVIHREPTSKIVLDHVTGYCRIWGCTYIQEYLRFYITR